MADFRDVTALPVLAAGGIQAVDAREIVA